VTAVAGTVTPKAELCVENLHTASFLIDALMSQRQNWFFEFDSADDAELVLLRHHLAQLDCRYYVFGKYEGPTGPAVCGYVLMKRTCREPHMRQHVPIARWTQSNIRSPAACSSHVASRATDLVEHGCVHVNSASCCNVIE